MKTVKALDLTNRRILKISGEESRIFLQGLASNDMMRVSENYAIYAALLTPQGKYLHDFFRRESESDFYLDCEATRIDDLFRRFKIFKLRSNIELEIVKDMTVTAFFGDGIYDNLPVEPIEGSATKWLDGTIFTDPRLNSAGIRAILPENSLKFSNLNFNCTSATFEEYEILRITLGLPDGSRDLVIDKSILLESGFEELNGVDFDKGCYVGQELTARTKHRGLIKKRLVPVSFSGIPPTSGAEIRKNNKLVGEVRSVSKASALALLRLEAIESEGEFKSGDTTLTLHKTEWVNF